MNILSLRLDLLTHQFRALTVNFPKIENGRLKVFSPRVPVDFPLTSFSLLLGTATATPRTNRRFWEGRQRWRSITIQCLPKETTTSSHINGALNAIKSFHVNLFNVRMDI